MKYWTSFINFIFIFIRAIAKLMRRLWNFAKAVYCPIYLQTHPTICKVFDWVNGKKTYIVSIASIIGLLIAYLEGSVSLSSLLSTLPCLIVAVTLRHGMYRHPTKAKDEIPKEYDPK